MVKVGETGAKVIVSELDIVNDGDGRGRTVEWCGGKDVTPIDVDEHKFVKPRQVTIGEADDGKVADLINVSVSVVETKGVWGIQVENKGGAKLDDKLVTVDTNCAEFVGVEVAS